MHRTNRRAHIFGALVAICAALAFSLTPLPAQALSTNSFYTGTRPGGGSRVNDAPLTAATGVTYALYYTDDSGQVSNYANVSDTDVNRMDKSVADVDLVHNLRAVLVVTNPGDGPISFHARLSTPYADYAGGGTEDRPLVRVSGAASFASTDDASEAYASLEADSGSTDPAPFADAAGAYAATNAWDDLKRVTLSGSIQPGETLTVTLPLELTNETRAVLYGHGFAKLGLWSSSTLEGRSNNASAFLRFARQLTEEDANGATVGRFQGGGKYLGVTVVPEGDLLAGTFTPVPADVQAAIPEISLEDFHFDNINYLDRHRATDDPTLYSGSVYSIDLRRIRDAIRDLGWSVGTGNSAVVYPGLPDWVLNEDENLDDDLMQEYRYRAAAKDAVILNPDGSDATLRGVNADGIRIGSIHVRLRPTIQTRDLELAVGDSWQPSDSLVSMSDHAGAEVGLDDAEHARVEHDVDTSLPGTYAVRFYHHYAGNAASGGDYETSRAATVAVTGTYRVAYDANGGTDAPDAEETRAAAATLETAVSSKEPTREGFAFVGWNTKADGTGTAYDAGAHLSLPYANHDLTLYAQWKPVEKDAGTSGQQGGKDGSSTSPQGEKNGGRDGGSPEKPGAKRASGRRKAGVPETGDATSNAPLFLLGAAIPLVAAGSVMIVRARRS